MTKKPRPSRISSPQGAKYSMRPHESGSGWIVTRAGTRSKVKISQALVERTSDRLAAGELIPFREISYTVAIEQAVLHILGDKVAIDSSERVYRAK